MWNLLLAIIGRRARAGVLKTLWPENWDIGAQGEWVEAGPSQNDIIIIPEIPDK